MEFLSLNTSAPADAGKRSKNPRRTLSIAIAAILIVLCWMVIEFRLFVGQAEQAMTALNIYTDTLIQQDYESAYLITSPAFRVAVSYPTLVEDQTKLNERFGRLKSAKQTDWDIDSINNAKIASIKADLQFERGNISFQFTLHKEDGIWRVFSYKEPGGTAMGEN